MPDVAAPAAGVATAVGVDGARGAPAAATLPAAWAAAAAAELTVNLTTPFSSPLLMSVPDSFSVAPGCGSWTVNSPTRWSGTMVRFVYAATCNDGASECVWNVSGLEFARCAVTPQTGQSFGTCVWFAVASMLNRSQDAAVLTRWD